MNNLSLPLLLETNPRELALQPHNLEKTSGFLNDMVLTEGWKAWEAFGGRWEDVGYVLKSSYLNSS